MRRRVRLAAPGSAEEQNAEPCVQAVRGGRPEVWLPVPRACHQPTIKPPHVCLTLVRCLIRLGRATSRFGLKLLRQFFSFISPPHAVAWASSGGSTSAKGSAGRTSYGLACSLAAWTQCDR